MFRSLRSKLVLSHVGLVLLAMIVLGGYLIQNMDLFYLETVRNRVSNDAAIISERIAPALAAGDTASVQDYLEAMGPHIEVRVLVTDVNGRIVGSTEPEDQQLLGQPGTLRGLPRVIASRVEWVAQRAGDPTTEVVFLGSPVELQGRQVGAIRLSYQLRDLDLEVERLTTIILYGLGAALTLGLLISLILAQSLSAPARSLVVAINKVSAGDLSYRIEPTGRDEIRDAGWAFDALADRLQQLERSRQQLLGDVAHDIHSSITGVSMAVEALQQGAVDDPAMRALLLDGLLSHSHRLNRMADDLLEVARIEGGRLRIQCADVQPDDLLRSVAAEFTAEAEQQSVAIQLQEGPRLPVVWADSHRLSQALGNLVQNAIRYTPPGGKVYLGGRALDDECVVYVRDEGPGISPRELEQLFNRFKHFESERPGKLGFGLSIARALVEAHGGRIEVASRPGEGATFNVILPAKTAVQGVPSAEMADSELPRLNPLSS